MQLPAPFGPYLLLRRIGAGGMAEVYLAEAPGVGGFEQLVCIKRIHARNAEDPEFVNLLIEEAKIVSHLVHPNIAQVFDLGQVNDQYYIAMEYVDGVDAFQVLKTAADKEIHLPVPAAAFIAQKLASGLAFAHDSTDDNGQRLGIIHRDVTPHNVIVSFEGEVKVIDFGVAKATLRSKQTEAGVIKGKYNYLSPEQAAGEVVDQRTDIFNAGIVLYELLAGEPLYAGDQIVHLLDAARKAKIPSLKNVRDDVPKQLQSILLKALAKKPKDRYATAAELSAELEAFLTQHAPGFGRNDLAKLVEWLVPARRPVVLDGPGSIRSGKIEFVSQPHVSLVSSPSLRITSSPDLDAERTRVAAPGEIEARREARAQGFELAPVPVPVAAPQPAAKASSGAFRPVALALGGVALLAAGALGVTFAVRASHEPAVLSVGSNPAGAEVFLDGRSTGLLTPVRLADMLEEGHAYQVEVRAAGFDPWTTQVVATEGVTQIEAQLTVSTGTLHVTSAPAGAQVFVDGVQRGATPLDVPGVPTARATRVEISSPGYLPVLRMVDWGAQRLVAVDATLTPE